MPELLLVSTLKNTIIKKVVWGKYVLKLSIECFLKIVLLLLFSTHNHLI